MAHIGTLQWGFLGGRGQLRPGTCLRLVNAVDDAAGRTLVLARRGPSEGPVRYGERLAFTTQSQLLVAGPPDGPAVVGVAVPPGGIAPHLREWELVGGVHDVAVPDGAPLALLNHTTGDFLVVPARGSGPTWWCGLGAVEDGDPFAGRPPLPLPAQLRMPAPEPAQALLSGVLDEGGDGWSLRLDPTVRTALLTHLADRPGLRLARWAAASGRPTPACDVLPLALAPGGAPRSGAWVLLSGAVVLDEAAGAVVVDPVDGLAWAFGGSDPSSSGPDDGAWAPLSVTWHVVTQPWVGRAAVYADHARASPWYLPLPARDGEPDSTTTFHLSGTSPRRRGVGGAGMPSVALVRDPRSGRRALRVQPPDGPVPLLCTVRVHPGRDHPGRDHPGRDHPGRDHRM